MKRFFYAKIALTNLKKNRQTYFPYLLTCIATIMMFYIMSSLSTNSVLNKMRGGATMGIVQKVQLRLQLSIYTAAFFKRCMNVRARLELQKVVMDHMTAALHFYTNTIYPKRRNCQAM